jgi:hypothetical protein
MLFKTGNATAWGVLAWGDIVPMQVDLNARSATVIDSFGTAVAAGGRTNVLNRYNTNQGAVEDPWIGFEGGHFDNIPKMMYGEGGFGWASHVAFKNANGGVNVFIREFVLPVLPPVPEPGSALLLLAGVAALAARMSNRAGG